MKCVQQEGEGTLLDNSMIVLGGGSATGIVVNSGGIIERIRKLGLNVAIDDFGTGYSSLNYLTKYPVDRLKIAQELVFGVTTDSRHSSVVRAAIRLAQELNIEVIAEGVESAEQALFLVSAGCKYAQGYYFSRPIGAESATKLLRDRAGVFERLIGADQTAA